MKEVGEKKGDRGGDSANQVWRKKQKKYLERREVGLTPHAVHTVLTALR